MASTTEVKVPDIGDFKDVAIIELLVKPGDAVRAEQSLITVESDKASMEIPSSHAGIVKELKVAIGDKVNEGTLIPAQFGALGNTGTLTNPNLVSLNGSVSGARGRKGAVVRRRERRGVDELDFHRGRLS